MKNTLNTAIISLLLQTIVIKGSITDPVNSLVSYFSPPPGCSQDDQDAQAIVDSKMKEEVIASILPYRDIGHRISINGLITKKNSGIAFIGDDYVPTDGSNPPFKDLCFGLVRDWGIVISGYLAVFFQFQDETWIIIALVLTPNMQLMMTTYDVYHKDKFDDMLDKQKHPFQNMLKVWCKQDREKDEEGEPNSCNVQQDANLLIAEQNDGGWHENRQQLETILMKKSFKYARAVIEKFENANGGLRIEDIIIANIQKNKLNHDLADAYASLARYIKNKYQYIADILRQYSDSLHRWANWIMCIAVVEPDEWCKIDEAFKQNQTNTNTSLSKFILQKNTDDKVMSEMMAVIVDSTFKPTTFTEKSVPWVSIFAPSLPSVPPTTVAPTATPAPSVTPAPSTTPAPTSNPASIPPPPPAPASPSPTSPPP